MICKLIWTGPRAELNHLDTLLSEVLFPPASAVSLIKTDPTRQDDESGWSLEAYFEDEPSESDLMGLVKEHGLSLEGPSPEDVPDQDWVAHSLEGLGAVTAGAFVLYGSHDADKVSEYKEIPILVEANRAFGTGHHPTTAGCLEALSHLQNAPVERVLDVGTGSGVLAIAARKLFTNAILVCTEIDPPSVDILSLIHI